MVVEPEEAAVGEDLRRARVVLEGFSAVAELDVERLGDLEQRARVVRVFREELLELVDALVEAPLRQELHRAFVDLVAIDAQNGLRK